MPKFPHSVLARFPLLLLERAERLGASRAELLAAAELNPSEIADLDQRVSVTKLWDLWRAVVDRLPWPTLGLRIGSGIHVRQAGLVGYAMLHSSTLGHAIRRLVRYERILEDTTYLALDSQDGHARLTLEEPAPLAGLRQPLESDVAGILTCLREITGAPSLSAEVHLPYPLPQEIAEYHEVLGPSVRFDQPIAALVLEDADLDLPVVARDETLCGYLDKLAESTLLELSAGSFTANLRRVLWDQLSEGQPTLGTVARTLGMSKRTLQRRLHQDGLTFAGLLEGFRERMAVELLQRKDLAIYEVAFLLGYSEPSTFFRAFRRWKHTSPRRFREKSSP